MKKWLIETFLPMWAKETVLSENRDLQHRLQKARQENETMRAFIRGIEHGMDACRYMTGKSRGQQ